MIDRVHKAYENWNKHITIFFVHFIIPVRQMSQDAQFGVYFQDPIL